MVKEEKHEGGDRDDLVEKKESPKGERAVKPVISLPREMGTEDWILKGTKLIRNTRKQRLKISSRGWIFKYNIKEKKKSHKNYKYVYIYMKFALKNRVFFLQSNSRL